MSQTSAFSILTEIIREQVLDEQKLFIPLHFYSFNIQNIIKYHLIKIKNVLWIRFSEKNDVNYNWQLDFIIFLTQCCIF